MGVRLDIEGAVVRDRPVLLVSNHSSWLDIPVLSAVAPVSFIAKKEVGTWPGVSALARLQRTVFVDRERPAAVGETAGEIVRRLAAGDSVVLFAEGTSSDGNRVLPFRTALFAAAKPSVRVGPQPPPPRQETGALAQTVVQTVAIVYTRLHGVPLSRADRPLIAWYGDMELPPHAWDLLRAGPLDARIVIGEPVSLDAFPDRKALARHSEDEVCANVVRILRGLAPDHPVALTQRVLGPRPVRQRRADARRSGRMV